MRCGSSTRDWPMPPCVSARCRLARPRKPSTRSSTNTIPALCGAPAPPRAAAGSSSISPTTRREPQACGAACMRPTPPRWTGGSPSSPNKCAPMTRAPSRSGAPTRSALSPLERNTFRADAGAPPARLVRAPTSGPPPWSSTWWPTSRHWPSLLTRTCPANGLRNASSSPPRLCSVRCSRRIRNPTFRPPLRRPPSFPAAAWYHRRWWPSWSIAAPRSARCGTPATRHPSRGTGRRPSWSGSSGAGT